MSNIKSIIFDLGGVLIDWDPRYLYRKIFDQEEEVNWFLDNICTMAWNEEQDSGRTWMEATAMKVLEYPEHSESINAYHTRWAEMLNGPIEKSVELLKTLRENDDLKIYALTNWSSETFPIARKRYDFLKLFEGIVVSGHEKTRKPYPEIYKILLNRYQVQPQETLFIDDNILNVKTGLSLGIDSIHFVSPSALKLELEKRNLL